MTPALLPTRVLARLAGCTPQYVHKLMRRGLLAAPVRVYVKAAQSKYPERRFMWPKEAATIVRREKRAGKRRELKGNAAGKNQHGTQRKERPDTVRRARCRKGLDRACVMGEEACGKCGYFGANIR
jgi:hypothetical protein